MNGLREKLRSMYAHDATVLAGIENGSVQGIPLTKGKITIVDADDYEWLSQWKWSAHKSYYMFYAERHTYPNGNDVVVKMHRAILGLSYGDGKIVDHRSRDGLDNRRTNLRIASRSLNKYNCKLYRNNTSGYRGVHWWKTACKWKAYININGKRKSLGHHPTAIDAAIAYDKSAIDIWGNDARLNFPDKRSEYVSEHI